MSTNIQHNSIPQRNTDTKNKTILHMHKYVLAMVGVLVLFIVTFPVAYMRVSLSNKYGGDAFKSLTWEEPQRSNSSDVSSRKAK